MAAFEEHEGVIRYLIEEWRYTYDQVLDYLALEGRGTTRRTMMWFCKQKGIGRTAHRVSENDIYTAVSTAINQVSRKYNILK